jgi:hypothetical protein
MYPTKRKHVEGKLPFCLKLFRFERLHLRAKRWTGEVRLASAHNQETKLVTYTVKWRMNIDAGEILRRIHTKFDQSTQTSASRCQRFTVHMKRCRLCRFPVSKVKEIMKRVMEAHLHESDTTAKPYSPDYTRPLADEIRAELRGMLAVARSLTRCIHSLPLQTSNCLDTRSWYK